MIKPYKHLQSEGHVKKNEWPTLVSGLMLIACLVVKSIQRWSFAICIQVKVIEMSMSIYGIHTSTTMPNLNVIA